MALLKKSARGTEIVAMPIGEGVIGEDQLDPSLVVTSGLLRR